MNEVQPVESSRVRAIKNELDKCATEYHAAKEEFEKARIEFEIAREKLTGVRQLASAMLTPQDWQKWRYGHPNVMHAGIPIGDAIMWVLWSHAWDCANETIKRNHEIPYSPGMDLQEILEDLEKGGFDFRTTTPLREINGALLQLKGITKLPTGVFQREDADEMFERMRQEAEAEAEAEVEEER